MSGARDWPFISIIIPMRNEAKYIGDCLDSVLRQDYPQDQIEVIVADGMSADSSRQIVEDYARRHGFIHLIDNPQRTVGPGLNAAIARATGRYILRMDAHAKYADDYIRLCVHYLEATGVENAGGTLITCPGADTAMAACIAAITAHPWVVGGSSFRSSPTARYSDGCFFGAWPREVFEQIGGFNEALTRNQDNEFNARILRYGGKIFQTPVIRVWYYNQATLSGLWRQAWRNGRYNVLTLIANPSSFRGRYFAPFLFDVWLLAIAALSALHPLFALALLGTLLIYGVFVGVVTRQIARQTGWRAGLLSLLAVPSYHVIYGLGSFSGILSYVVFGKTKREQARAGSRVKDPANPPQLGRRAIPEADAVRVPKPN